MVHNKALLIVSHRLHITALALKIKTVSPFLSRPEQARLAGEGRASKSAAVFVDNLTVVLKFSYT